MNSYAKLSFSKDKGRIFKHVKNIDREFKIGVGDDYPREVEEIRKALPPVLKKSLTGQDESFVQCG